MSTTGVAGLTLGGGLGWLMSKYGLALDNLLSVELVTADGKVTQASLEEEPDLFWAVRGGGNFGVATSFEFRLHPVGPAITRPTHIDVDVRVVLWWGHADALEFPHPDADFRDAAVVGPVRRRGSA